MSGIVWSERWMAVAGLAGALLMFAGDMLFYGQWGSGAGAISESFALAAAASPDRLALGGLVAPVAGAGLLCGVFHVLNRLGSSPAIVRWIVVICLLLVVMIAVATHAVWGAFALAATTHEPLAVMRVYQYLQMHFLVGAAPAAVATILLLVAVACGRSGWPRWMIVFNPGVLYLIMSSGTWSPAPVGAALVGGAFNLSLAFFFAASLVAPVRLSSRLGAKLVPASKAS